MNGSAIGMLVFGATLLYGGLLIQITLASRAERRKAQG